MSRFRRPAAVLALVAALFFPVLATAGPAQAAPATGGRSQAAAAPASPLLVTLADLLARILPLPPAIPGLAPSLVSQVSASTVKVTGVACGYRLSGSGFSAAPDTVVTNA